MAKYRQIHTSFWDDPYIESLDPETRQVFIYLLTNPFTTQCGVYQITLKKISYHTGYDTSTIRERLDKLEGDNKIRYVDDTSEVCLINWGKYNLARAGKPILDCLKKELLLVKNFELLRLILENIENQSIKKLFEDFLRNVHDTSTSGGQEEEEEEKEEEEYSSSNSSKCAREKISEEEKSYRKQILNEPVFLEDVKRKHKADKKKVEELLDSFISQKKST